LARTRCALRVERDDRRLDRSDGTLAVALPVGTVERDSGDSLSAGFEVRG
jgi:hypothetical protein